MLMICVLFLVANDYGMLGAKLAMFFVNSKL